MGPWMYNSWQRNDLKSSGAPIDPLLPELFESVNGAALDPRNVPNYSRFPGDTLGLNSVAALSAFRKFFVPSPTAISMSRVHYNYLPMDLNSPKGDVLAWSKNDLDNNLNKPPELWGPPVRQIEMAAVAPDLFDVTYYSIDPNYMEMYGKRAMNYFGQGTLLRGDLGSRQGLDITVKEQIKKVNEIGDPLGITQFILDPQRLLTSWAPEGANTYDQLSDLFGVCAKKGQQLVPGGCAVGGRTGYSVKLISKDYLTSPELQLGGPNVVGPILNAPPESF